MSGTNSGDNLEEQNLDINVELDTGIDTSTGVKDGSELDQMLDRTMGITSNAKTITPDNKTTLPTDKTVDANGKKPGEEGYIAPTGREQRDSTRVNPAHTPRAYGKAFKWNEKGDVVLAATGEVIAQAGAARKSFERMLPIISAAQTEADKYKGMYEAAANANTIATQLKLAPEEYAIGARIMATFKSDPKKAIAFLVSEAQNNGVDVSDLGVGGGGISVAAIEKVLQDKIDAALKPFSFITADREQQEQDREAHSQANDVVNDFLESMPDAEIHMDSIAKVMNTNPGKVSITEAYWILNAHAAKHQLDWTKELGPQLAAKLGKTPNKGQPANNGRTLPDLNGRQGNDSVVTRNRTVMSGEASTSDIVKEAMRDAGMVIE